MFKRFGLALAAGLLALALGAGVALADDESASRGVFGFGPEGTFLAFQSDAGDDLNTYAVANVSVGNYDMLEESGAALAGNGGSQVRPDGILNPGQACTFADVRSDGASGEAIDNAAAHGGNVACTPPGSGDPGVTPGPPGL